MKKLYAIFIAIIICISPILAISVLTPGQGKTFNEKNFPLEIDLLNTNFNVGEKISFKATITNKSGEDVNVTSNGQMPCIFFHNINDTPTHSETTIIVEQILRANDKIPKVFEYTAVEAGTYILDIHYHIEVNGIEIHDKIDDIIIEVK